MATVHVIATTFEGTRAALDAAIPLASGSRASLTLVVPQVVPYAVDIEAPLPSTVFFVKRYQRIIADLGGTVAIDVCHCRGLDEIASNEAQSGATVVIGGPAGRWLTSPEERFAGRLAELGCRVVFVASGPNPTQRRMAPVAAMVAIAWFAFASPALADAQDRWQYGGFVDIGTLLTTNAPENHLFRNRSTTPDVNELDLNMAAAYVRKLPTEMSRGGFEATVQGGKDSEAFGFAANAQPIAGANVLRHFGPLNASYLAPVGAGLTIQGGIFSSLIGYDSLYAKDNFAYTRGWGGDYTPYLMTGVNVAYPLSTATTITGFLVNSYAHLSESASPLAGGQIAVKANDRLTLKETAMYGAGRFFSDSIAERKTSSLTFAAEYQVGAESDALWMAAQVPIQWRLGAWAVTGRPEFAWDRDGRWIGEPQSIAAFTATVERQVSLGPAKATLSGEYRVDHGTGSGGGFYAGADNHLVPTQHLFILSTIVTFDGARK
jgi:hypothetical protein